MSYYLEIDCKRILITTVETKGWIILKKGSLVGVEIGLVDLKKELVGVSFNACAFFFAHLQDLL